MARAALTYFFVGVLFVLFALASMLAGPIALAYLVAFRADRTAAITHAMDRLLAAMLPFRFSGRSTVSKECGNQVKSNAPCAFCRVLCIALNWMLKTDGPSHCEAEAD